MDKTPDAARPIRPIGAPPPPPPPPPAGYRPAGPVDPKYADGFFATGNAATSSSTWTERPATDREAGPRSIPKPFLVLLIAVVAAVAGYLGYKALSGPEEIVYTGENGVVDAVDPESFFVPASGYRYRNMPGAAKNQIDSLMSRVGGIYGAPIDTTMKAVVEGGRPIGAVIVIGLPAEQVQSTIVDEDPLEMVKGQANGGEVERLEVGGKPAFTLEYGPTHQILALYENQILVVTTMTEAATRTIAETILTALP